MSTTTSERLSIVWEGHFATTHSFSVVNRAICERLLQRGHDVCVQPAGLAECEATSLAEYPLLAGHLRRAMPADALHVSHRWPPRLARPACGAWVLMQPWEYGSMPEAWLEPMTHQADQVWVYSNYVSECFQRSGVPAGQLHVVGLGVDPQRFHPQVAPRVLSTGRRFKFLFVGGTIPRKGIDVLLDADRLAFSAADDVCLVIKDLGSGPSSFYRGQTAQSRLAAWHNDGNAPAIEYHDDVWPDDELPGLYAACDCLVAPYRGEGFGLPIAEALACGLPAIVTGHGAALDYCNNENAYLVPAKEVRLSERRIGDIPTLDCPWWAEPDRDALVELLRHVARHPEVARAKGQAGAASIREGFTWDHTAQRVEELLRECQCRKGRAGHVNALEFRGVDSPGWPNQGVDTRVDTPRSPGQDSLRGPNQGVDTSRSPGQDALRSPGPHLSLTMIVKNEADNLATCLQSLRGIADEMIVVDTGSSDATKEVALQHGARVFDFTWCDSFAAARNESLRHACGSWLLWLDGDEYFDEANRAKLKTLLAHLRDDDMAAFVMKQASEASRGGSAMLVDQVRLFRNHPDIRWEYRVHEQILLALRRVGHAVRFTDISVSHTGYVDPALRHKKLERNLRLLHLDLAERPNDPFTLFNLGWAYCDLGRHADAIPLLQHSLGHSHPGDSITPKLYALLAQCQRRQGEVAQAWATCRAGRTRCPNDAELLFVEGQLAHQRGDRTAARACWTQLLGPANGRPRVPPPEPGFASVDAGLRGHLVHYHLAVLAREEGRHAEAEEHWRSALAQVPALAPARLGLAELYLLQRRWAELEQVLAELQADEQVAGSVAVLRARAALMRKQFAAARQPLEDVLSRAPDALLPRVVLSHVFLQSGDEAAAEPLLRQIVAADPSQAETWRNLAVLLRRRGQLSEALAAVQSGRSHCPDDPELLLCHGALLRESGAPAEAEACLLRVLETTPSNGADGMRAWQARHNLALLYRGQGRLREAMTHWRALLSDNPDLVTARRCLAECYLAEGRLDDAETLVAELDGNDPETLLLRARVSLAQRQFTEARRALEEVLARAPRWLEARVLLSYVHLQEDRDPAAAEGALRAVLELDPDNKEARHNLGVLRHRFAVSL
jgi:glycosyltransferase involved in cell wall biosynthesis/tetratricopeptide (TPR) repeat protein